MAEITRDQVVDYLSNLPVIQIAELVKELEDKWGVSAAPVAIPGSGGGPVVETAPEQSEFDVVLTGVESADKRVGMIKLVREITQKGLKEAKDMVEASSGSPQVLKESLPKDLAEELMAKIKEAGGLAELK